MYRAAALTVLIFLAALRMEAGLAGPSPVLPEVVFVHGGGWVAGSSRAGQLLEPFYASHGFRFEAIDYPLRPKATLSAMVESIATTLDRISGAQHAPLIVVAHSAGAQLAAAAVLQAKSNVRCLILLDGIGYDLADVVAKQPGLQRRLNLSAEQARRMSPVALLPQHAKYPAIFLAAGSDQRDTWGQAQNFARAAQRAGLPVTLIHFDNMAHSDFLLAWSSENAALPQAVDRFLALHDNCR